MATRHRNAAASPAPAPVVAAEVAKVDKPDTPQGEPGEASGTAAAGAAPLANHPSSSAPPVRLIIRNHSAAVLVDRVHGLLLPPGGCVHAEAADEAHADEIRNALAALAAENYIAADLLTIESA